MKLYTLIFCLVVPAFNLPSVYPENGNRFDQGHYINNIKSFLKGPLNGLLSGQPLYLNYPKSGENGWFAGRNTTNENLTYNSENREKLIRVLVRG